VGSYRLALGTRLVEALDSRTKTAALACIIGLLLASTELFVPVATHLWLHVATLMVAGTAISYVFLVGARARRLAVLDHVRKIAELNHNVRNALDVILAAQYLSQDVAERDRKLIVASVERIDQTLRHLFPAVGERKEDRSGALPPDMRRPSRSAEFPQSDDRRVSSQ